MTAPAIDASSASLPSGPRAQLCGGWGSRVLPGVIGSLQALEVIKLILGAGASLSGRLLIFDALDLSWREVALRRNPDCPVCGDAPTQTGLIDYEDFCGLRFRETDMTQDEVQELPATFGEVGPQQLKQRLVGADPPLLLDVREPFEWDIVSLKEFEEVRVPLGQLSERMNEVPAERDIVVYCRSGARSRVAATSLVEAGFRRVDNLTGGVLAWADEIDPSLPRY